MCPLLLGTPRRQGSCFQPAHFFLFKGSFAPSVREYLNHVVQEIRWADRLNPFNPYPHFTDYMPISSIGGEC